MPTEERTRDDLLRKWQTTVDWEPVPYEAAKDGDLLAWMLDAGLMIARNWFSERGVVPLHFCLMRLAGDGGYEISLAALPPELMSIGDNDALAALVARTCELEPIAGVFLVSESWIFKMPEDASSKPTERQEVLLVQVELNKGTQAAGLKIVRDTDGSPTLEDWPELAAMMPVAGRFTGLLCHH